LIEAQIGRYKRVIGNALRSHTEGARRAEVAIADHVLNRMNDLGHPKSLRAFLTTNGEACFTPNQSSLQHGTHSFIASLFAIVA
jgi:hypothetical protein